MPRRRFGISKDAKEVETSGRGKQPKSVMGLNIVTVIILNVFSVYTNLSGTKSSGRIGVDVLVGHDNGTVATKEADSFQVSSLNQSDTKKIISPKQRHDNGLNITMIKENTSWLRKNINVGKYLGGGSITDVFEANIEPKNNDFIKNRKWILRISGCDKETDTSEITRNEINILQRLNPDPLHHEPAYPFLLYAAENITNPFHKSSSDNYTLTFPNDFKDKQYYMNCPRMTILIVERFENLQDTFDLSTKRYKVPTGKFKCFWRKLFEVLGHAHKRGVMLRDPSKRNVMIQDGKIKLFDWNHGKVYNPKRPERVHDHSLGFNGPPEYRQGRNDTYVNSHAFDVWVVSNWINNLLHENRPLEGDDLHLLRNLSVSMRPIDPADRPTLLWLLENHPYFTLEKTNSCILSW